MRIKSFPKQQYNYPFRKKSSRTTQQPWKPLIKAITEKESLVTSDIKAEFNNLVHFKML